LGKRRNKEKITPNKAILITPLFAKRAGGK
jgi:hypothetical protein